MEAIGLVASLVNILQGIDSVCKVARANVHSSSSASREFGLLLGKLTVYKGLIEGIHLQLEVDEASRTRITSIAYAGGPLQACSSAIELIEARIQHLPKHVVFGKIIDKDIAQCLKTFDNALPVLQLALDAEQRAITSAVETYVRDMGKDVETIRELAETNNEYISEIRQLLLDGREQQLNDDQQAERQALRRWLTRCNPEIIFETSIQTPLEGSGTWFISGFFQKWLDEDSKEKHQILWLRGRSGAGKTTLASLAINRVKAQSPKDGARSFAYFYCSFNNKESRSSTSMLASYVVQLCEQVPQLWSVMSSTSKSYLRGMEMRDSDEEDLKTVIAAGCDMRDEILLFLDAPNESEHPEDILDTVAELVARNRNLRILISSTDDISIDDESGKLLLVNMDQGHVHYDLHEYLTWKTRSERRLRRLDITFQNKIIDTLVSHSDACFRWAVCQLSAIVNNARSEAAIERSLRTLSRSLEELYTDSLLSVPPDDVSLVQAALLWLTFAIRPMQIQELSEAMILQEGFSAIDPSARLFNEEAEDIVRKCRMLIDYNISDGTVKLAHASVRDFLLSDSCKRGFAKYFYLNRQQSLTKLSKFALGYLNLDVFSSGYCQSADLLTQREQQYPLSRYVSDAWPAYVEYSSFYWPSDDRRNVPHVDLDDEKLKEAIQMFLGTAKDKSFPRGGNFGSWIQFIFPRHAAAGIRPSNPLYYAARNNMENIANIIVGVEGSACLESKGGSRYSTPLHAAAAFGNSAMVSFLLAKGADPNEVNGFGERGIEWAAFYGNSEIVQLLLNHGAQPITEQGMEHIHGFINHIKTSAPTYYVAKEAADANDQSPSMNRSRVIEMKREDTSQPMNWSDSLVER